MARSDLDRSDLLLAAVAVTRTKRRRYLWCAWWTGAPCADPFRPPDAWKGGLRTVEEAVSEARRVTGLELSIVESRWAGAWLRVRGGLSPFPERPLRAAAPAARPIDPHLTLGVSVGATLEDLKARFRASARLLHPDHGGDAAAFIAMKKAYDTLLARRARRR